MCYGSLVSARSRPAVLHDCVVTKVVAGEIIGLVSVHDVGLTVCMLKDTSARLLVPPEMKKAYSFLESLPYMAFVTFSQRSPTGHNPYEDRFIFEDLDFKPSVLLQHFPLGLQMMVSCLPYESRYASTPGLVQPVKARQAVRELEPA